MNAKPICIVRVNYGRVGYGNLSFNEAQSNIQKNLEEKLEDYHVFVLPSHDEEDEPIRFQVLNELDMTDIEKEKLKKMILDEVTKYSTIMNTEQQNAGGTGDQNQQQQENQSANFGKPLGDVSQQADKERARGSHVPEDSGTNQNVSEGNQVGPGNENENVTAENTDQAVHNEETGHGFRNHEVTQEDLDNNPALAENGVKVGDTIQIPLKPEEGEGKTEEQVKDEASQ